jgi:hypothetical protein
MTLENMDAALKDRYPLPGARIKQYVLDERREAEWERSTCPLVSVPAHLDNTAMACGGRDVRWIDLYHAHCCDVCGEAGERAAMRPDIVAWRAERDSRPKPCEDRELLSDEIEPEMPSLRDHPFFAMIAGKI